MGVKPEEVQAVAKLANIELTPGEVHNLSLELGNIFGFVQQLDEVNVEGIDLLGDQDQEPQPLRHDVVADGGKRDKVLANAPEARHGYFIVPKVVE